MRWLGKFHVQGKYVDIPEYSRNNKTRIIQYVDDDNKVEDTKEKEDKDAKSENEGLNKKINQKLQKLHKSYNPTVYDITEILLVGGTDESYEAPTKFEEA